MSLLPKSYRHDGYIVSQPNEMMEIPTRVDFYKHLSAITGGYPVIDGTVFFDEVGIDGLDADLFIIEIADKYNVDMSNFNAIDYYTGDMNVLELLYRSWVKREKPAYKRFTASHLYEIICKGCWFDQ